MPLEPAQLQPLMCLTQDGLALSHREQAERLCAVGARWIQLRLKGALPAEWIATAEAVVAVCRRHGAVCIVNDSVDVALAAGADGVHLNWRDEDWTRARRRLGAGLILGGTVNEPADAARAAAAGVLDYVGIGPWRFTRTKLKLAPLLGAAGVQALVRQMAGLPAWAIGGIVAADLAEVRATGACGAAVSSALYVDGRVEENYRAFDEAWKAAAKDSPPGSPTPATTGRRATRSNAPGSASPATPNRVASAGNTHPGSASPAKTSRLLD